MKCVMKIRYIPIILAILLSLAACNKQGTVDLSTTDSPLTEPVTLPTATQASPNQTPDTSDQSTNPETDICPPGTAAVAIIIDPDIVDSIRSGLTQFVEDLGKQGFHVFETSAEFPTAVELRTYLSDLYLSTEKCLKGAYLIGDLPHAYQWFRVEYANPDIPPSEQEVISFQYYADLDGIFSASADYTSPGDHLLSFDIHEGDLDWEIWVGVLPVYKGDNTLTTQAINNYFERNHAYRQGEYNLPHAYLEINEFFTAATEAEHDQIGEMLRSGQYAWTPFSNAPNTQIFFNSSTAEMTVEQGYSALSEGVADFTGVKAHGSWFSSGRINIDWVESNPVQTVIFSTSGCSAGNLDQDDNFLSSVLYSPTSLVLVAWGTTSESGGMGKNTDGFYGHNVASDLAEGKSFGEAILEHVNTPLVHPYADSRELHYSLQIFLGDPSLTLFP